MYPKCGGSWRQGESVSASVARPAAASRGRSSDWRPVGAGRLGISECKASGGDDYVDELGVSVGEGMSSGLEIRTAQKRSVFAWEDSSVKSAFGTPE